MRDPSHPVFCLIVEGDPHVGLDLADALEADGYYVAGPFRCGRTAARWLERFTPDIAVVDSALPDGSCDAVVATLRARAIPVVVTSRAERDRGIPGDGPGSLWLRKPVPAAIVADALAGLLRPLGITEKEALAALQQECHSREP